MTRTREQLDARLTMPRTKAGFVMSLFYVPERELAAYEAEWRAWLQAHPRHLWPSWVDAWIEKRKQERKQDAA